MADPTDSSLVLVSNMPLGRESVYIYTCLLLKNTSVKEIEAARYDDHSTDIGFHIYFGSSGHAQAFNAEYDQSGAGEYSHIHKKYIDVKVIPISAGPKHEDVRLCSTDFLRENGAMPFTKACGLAILVIVDCSCKCIKRPYEHNFSFMHCFPHKLRAMASLPEQCLASSTGFNLFAQCTDVHKTM